MKKIFALSMLLMSAVIFVPFAEAKTSSNNSATNTSAAPQVRITRNQIRYNRRNRPVRVVNSVRNLRVGRRIYRETYQTRYQPNGRTVTRLISRVLVGRY